MNMNIRGQFERLGSIIGDWDCKEGDHISSYNLLYAELCHEGIVIYYSYRSMSTHMSTWQRKMYQLEVQLMLFQHEWLLKCRRILLIEELLVFEVFLMDLDWLVTMKILRCWCFTVGKKLSKYGPLAGMPMVNRRYIHLVHDPWCFLDVLEVMAAAYGQFLQHEVQQVFLSGGHKLWNQLESVQGRKSEKGKRVLF